MEGYQEYVGGLVTATVTNSDGSIVEVFEAVSTVVTSFQTAMLTDEDSGLIFRATGTIFGVTYSNKYWLSLSFWPRAAPTIATSTENTPASPDATATSTTTVTVTEANSTATSGAGENGGLTCASESSSNTPFIAAIAVLAALFFIALVVACVFWRKARALRKEKEALGSVGAVILPGGGRNEHLLVSGYEHTSTRSELPNPMSDSPVELQQSVYDHRPRAQY